MLGPWLICAVLSQAPATTPEPGRPRLHIDADRSPLLLFKLKASIHDGPAASEPLCVAPCDHVIDGRGADEFFFGAPGIAPSGNFQLRDLDGDLKVTVRAGNQRLTVLGFVASGVGFFSFSAGAAGLLGKQIPLSLSLTGVIFGLLTGSLGAWIMYEGRTTYEFTSVQVVASR
jgi:hypothetical protein